MELSHEPPPAGAGAEKASRLTTIVLIISLVLVVLIAGVLGTVAVLMTRAPDQPLLGGTKPQRLAVAIHFAPVRETKAAPCPPDTQGVVDAEQKNCFLLEDGVTVNAVQRIEAVRDKNGTYSVRIAVAPAFKDKVSELIDELSKDQRQVVVVLVPSTVLAAPYVTQDMKGDSLSISGYSKEEADALVSKLLGTAAPSQPQTSTGATTQPTGPATTGQPTTGTGLPNTGTGQPTTGTTGQPTTGLTQPTTGTTAPVGGTRKPDPKYPSCKEVVAAGKGPYSKGVHEEYYWYPDVDHNGAACNSADIH